MKSEKRSTRKVGNYIVSNPGSIKFMVNKFIEEGKGIKNTDNGEVYLNPLDLGRMVLEMADGDYGVLFEQMGVNDESIQVATEYANKKISEHIGSLVEEALKKFR